MTRGSVVSDPGITTIASRSQVATSLHRVVRSNRTFGTLSTHASCGEGRAMIQFLLGQWWPQHSENPSHKFHKWWNLSQMMSNASCNQGDGKGLQIFETTHYFVVHPCSSYLVNSMPHPSCSWIYHPSAHHQSQAASAESAVVPRSQVPSAQPHSRTISI